MWTKSYPQTVDNVDNYPHSTLKPHVFPHKKRWIYRVNLSYPQYVEN